MRLLGLAAMLSLIACATQEADQIAGRPPGKVDTGRTISLQADVACTPSESYALWSTDEGVRSFFAPDSHVEARAGGAYTIIFFPSEDPQGRAHGTLGAHVLAASSPDFFSFEWVVFAGDDLKGDYAPPYAPPSQRLPATLPTWVELRFTSNATGTHVDFRHLGFGDGALWSQSQAWFTRAWSGVLNQMRETCAA